MIKGINQRHKECQSATTGLQKPVHKCLPDLKHDNCVLRKSSRFRKPGYFGWTLEEAVNERFNRTIKTDGNILFKDTYG